MIPPASSQTENISRRLVRQINDSHRAFKIALGLSLIIHAFLLLPGLFNKTPRRLSDENLVEVRLLDKAPKSKPKSRPPVKHRKPTLKPKRKLKHKKKSKPKKKLRKVTKESTLARRRSVPKKKKPAADNKLEAIKKRLARQQEEEKLNQIRQRLRRSVSPAAKARQSRLTQAYSQTLTAWIMRNWHLPEYLLNSGLEATISLTISASGTLINLNEEQLSGNSIFDNAMRQAISNANPFPPFPAELTIPREEFVITFNPNKILKEN